MARRMLQFQLLALLAVANAQDSSSPPAAAPTSGYCYYPAANAVAQDARPCDPKASVSMCCPVGWTCMSNHICEVTDSSKANAAIGRVQRGTCTTPGWNNDTCGDFCLNLPVNDNDGDLVPCGDNVFACAPWAQDGSANCAKKQKVFTLPIGEAQTVIGVPNGVTSTSQVPVSTLAGASSTGTAASASGTSSPTATPKPEKKTHLAPIIGGVVGGVLGGALIAFLLWFFWWRPRHGRSPSPDAIEDLNTHHAVPEHHQPMETIVPTIIRPHHTPQNLRPQTEHVPETDDGHTFIPEVDPPRQNTPADLGGAASVGSQLGRGFARDPFGGSMSHIDEEGRDYSSRLGGMRSASAIPPIPNAYAHSPGNLMSDRARTVSPRIGRGGAPYE